MKGVNASRIAAIAASTVMLASSAVAAGVMYENVELVNPNGQPTAKVVVGSNAAISDGVAAANIASVLANYAYKSSTLSAELSGQPECSVSGEISGAGTCEVSNEKVTIEISLPGQLANAHQFQTLITDSIDRHLRNRNSSLSEDNFNATLSVNDVSTTLSPLRDAASGQKASAIYRIGSGQFSGFSDQQVKDPQAGSDFAYTAEQAFWFGTGDETDGVIYDNGANYKSVIAKPSVAAYSVTFRGNDYGIPYCTKANEASGDGDWEWCSNDSSSQYRSDNHRIKVPFMGSEWVISSMSLPSSNDVLNSSTEGYAGGTVKLAKEAKYDIINVGGVIDAGNFKIRLADISTATGSANVHPAIIDVLDANDAVVGQIQVDPGDTYTFTQSSTGEQIKVHVYRTAPGFTLSAKWSEIAVYTDEITLQDGKRYNLVSSGDPNYDWEVSLIWKNRDFVSASSSSGVADSLREIVLYDDNSFPGNWMVEGDVYNFPKEDTAFRLTYNGLDLSEDDYSDVSITGLSQSTYEVSNATSSADCTDDANKWTYKAKMLRFSSSGNKFGGSTGDLLGNYRVDEFYYDPIGRTADNSTSLNGTQNTSADRSDWRPLIFYQPASYDCYIVSNVTGGTSPNIPGAGQSVDSTNTVAFEPAGVDSGAYGLFYFHNASATNSLGFAGEANNSVFYQEDAGKNNTQSHVPVFVEIPFYNDSSQWKFKGTSSTTTNVFYSGLRDGGSWVSNEPTFISERGSKIDSISTTSYALSVAEMIAKPTFTFAYADEELASSGEEWIAEEGDEKELSDGVKLKIKEISQTVGTCQASTDDGAEPSCTVNTDSVSARIMPNNVASLETIEPYDIKGTDLVVTDSEAGNAGGVVITVGGPVVNSVTADVLADSAVDFDTTNVYVKAIGSKIVVAGKTAADTMQAADEFINELVKE